jgi:hypothetical protein
MRQTRIAAIALLGIVLVSTIACGSSSQVVITYCAAGCQTSWLGDGTCQNACNNAACYYDNGDCSYNPTATQSSYYCSGPCLWAWVGNGECDDWAGCNVAACNYDGGDCPGSSSSSDGASVYNTTRDELKNAVAEYASRNMGMFPYLTGTYSVPSCPSCHVIDVNELLTSHGGILALVPDGLYSASGGDNDNCDGGAYGCSSNNHYVWIIDVYGNVYSKCMGYDCDIDTANGYQGVWP